MLNNLYYIVNKKSDKQKFIYNNWLDIGKKIILTTEGHAFYNSIRTNKTVILIYAREAIEKGNWRTRDNEYQIRIATNYEQKIIKIGVKIYESLYPHSPTCLLEKIYQYVLQDYKYKRYLKQSA